MIQPTPDELEMLIAHEARYFEIWSRVTRTDQVWFLDGVDMPDYQSANRALHLRFTEGSQTDHDPESLITQIIGHFRARGLPIVVDVDPTAEEMGFGRALRKRGVTPVVGSTLLMHFTGDTMALPSIKNAGAPCAISLIPRAIAYPTNSDSSYLSSDNSVQVPNSGNNGPGISVNTRGELPDDMLAWVTLAGSDEDNEASASFWRRVAAREALAPDCRLYLARVEDQPAGACQLFSHANWGLIDSVITHPAYRRRGIASQLVAQAVQDSQQLGNTLTYLYTERASAGEQVYRKLGFEVWGVDILRRHILY